MRQFINIALVLMVLFSVCACGRNPIAYLDTKDVKIIEVHQQQEEDHLLIFAVLQNDDSSRVHHPVYRINWLDKEGRTIEQTSWRPIIVKGGNTVHIKERSTVPGVCDFTILISNDAS